MMEHTKNIAAVSWALRGVVAAVLLQTLFFKFTGARESVYIFSTLGAEPWGRIGSGVVELIAAILLLWPRTVVLGAGLSLATMAGAILSHLLFLGITMPEVGDRGELFALAVLVLVCSAAVLVLHRAELLALLPAARRVA
jgi:DoxX-like family